MTLAVPSKVVPFLVRISTIISPRRNYIVTTLEGGGSRLQENCLRGAALRCDRAPGSWHAGAETKC